MTLAHIGDPIVLHIVVTNTGTDAVTVIKLFDGNFVQISLTCTPPYDQYEGVTLVSGASLDCVADPYFVTFTDRTNGEARFTTIATGAEVATSPAESDISVPVS